MCGEKKILYRTGLLLRAGDSGSWNRFYGESRFWHVHDRGPGLRDLFKSFPGASVVQLWNGGVYAAGSAVVGDDDGAAKIPGPVSVFLCDCGGVGIVLSFSFFGMWHFEGVKAGTVLCAMVNGYLIRVCSGFWERHWTFVDRFRG